jgi:hypothetical protein
MPPCQPWRSPLPPVDCMSAVFSAVEEPRRALPPHPAARRGPREVGPGGLLHARQGGGHRAGYRGLTRDSRALCPRWPARPRLWRLVTPPQDWPQTFLAAPTVLGGLAPYGLARLHPRRAGRRPPPSGRTGRAHPRWLGGGQGCRWRHQWGFMGGACATAQVADHPLPWLMRQCEARRMVLSETGWHAPAGDPAHLPHGQRGAWQERLLVETGRAMLTVLGHGKRVMPRVWDSGEARLACPMAACTVLVQWHGFQP